MDSKRVIGVDVGKRWLDVSAEGENRSEHLANTAEQVAAFVGRLDPARDVVVFERTGGYERVLEIALAENGVPWAVVHSQRLKAFRLALGIKAKTDAIDCKLLRGYGRNRLDAGELRFGRVADVTLHGLLTRHRQLEAMLHAERCRLAMAPEGAVRASIENLIGHLEADLPVIEAELAALEARDAEFRLKRDVLCQQIGIANKTARKLLAHVPELGQVNAKAAASLGGLAPHVHQSGTIERHQGLVHGRGCVRSTLFLPALTAMRRDPEMARFAKRLRDRGKPKMVVVVAVMRKLLVRLNARLRDALAAGTVEQTAAPAAV